MPSEDIKHISITEALKRLFTKHSNNDDAWRVQAEVSDGVTGALFTKVLPLVQVTHPGTDTWVSGADNTNTNGRTFTSTQNIRKLTIFVTPATAFTGNEGTDEYILVVVDAGNGALAKDIFSETLTDTVSDTHAYYKIPFNTRVELPISELAITRVDLQPTVVAHATVEGE